MTIKPYSSTNPEGYPEIPRDLADKIFAKAVGRRVDPEDVNSPGLDACILVTIDDVIYKVLIPYGQVCHIVPRGEPGEACWVWALATPQQDKAIRTAAGRLL